MSDKSTFVSRAGDKLQGALEAFGVDVSRCVCADFGCNVGGFTDCLLQHGAAKVYAIDTGYGELAWKLRKDPRVVVMERTNALYCPVVEAVDLAVIDVAWTSLALAAPAAMKWLTPPADAMAPEGSPNVSANTPAAGPAIAAIRRPVILALLKPHYELARIAGHKPHGVLELTLAREVCQKVCRRLAELHLAVLGVAPSALLGKGGNVEFFLLLEVSRMSA